MPTTLYNCLVSKGTIGKNKRGRPRIDAAMAGYVQRGEVHSVRCTTDIYGVKYDILPTVSYRSPPNLCHCFYLSQKSVQNILNDPVNRKMHHQTNEPMQKHNQLAQETSEPSS